MPSFKELVAKLATIAHVREDLPPKVATALTGKIGEEFVHQQDSYGNPWAPDSAITVRKKGHGHVLYETGKMLSETEAVANGLHIGFVGPDYGPSHQHDSVNRWGRINPARPVIPNGPALPKEWQETIADELGNAVSNALKR